MTSLLPAIPGTYDPSGCCADCSESTNPYPGVWITPQHPRQKTPKHYKASIAAQYPLGDHLTDIPRYNKQNRGGYARLHEKTFNPGLWVQEFHYLAYPHTCAGDPCTFVLTGVLRVAHTTWAKPIRYDGRHRDWDDPLFGLHYHEDKPEEPTPHFDHPTTTSGGEMDGLKYEGDAPAGAPGSLQWGLFNHFADEHGGTSDTAAGNSRASSEQHKLTDWGVNWPEGEPKNTNSKNGIYLFPHDPAAPRAASTKFFIFWRTVAPRTVFRICTNHFSPEYKNPYVRSRIPIGGNGLGKPEGFQLCWTVVLLCSECGGHKWTRIRKNGRPWPRLTPCQQPDEPGPGAGGGGRGRPSPGFTPLDPSVPSIGPIRPTTPDRWPAPPPAPLQT